MTDPVRQAVPADTAGLTLGRYKKPAPTTFPFLIRFVNLVNYPPEGVRYEILVDRKTVAKRTVSATENETTFEVSEGALITLMIQAIGDTALRPVKTFTASSTNPVLLARIKSAKLSSRTELHPQSASSTQKGSSASTSATTSEAVNDKQQGVSNRLTKNSDGIAEHHILPGKCACARELTLDELAAIFPSRKKAQLGPFLEPLNRMMETYQIHTCLRKAHALAQLGHESGHLKYRAEILPPNKTEEVQYNGYMGRGLIQLTGKENYAAYGRFKNADFLGENRLKLESHEYATDSAGWFWNYGRSCGLSDYADKNDLIFLSAEINGGFNGFQDRAGIFQRAHAMLNADKCKDERHRSSVYLPFEQSKAYDNRDLAFAWGLWSDPGTKRHGLAKNAAASVAGYRRFLELNERTPIKRRRFGFESTDALIQYAKEKTS